MDAITETGPWTEEELEERLEVLTSLVDDLLSHIEEALQAVSDMKDLL